MRFLLVVAALVLSGISPGADAPTTFMRDDYGGAASARAIAAADFDQDGWLDLATAGTRGSIRILLNNGPAGRFRALPERSLGGGPFDLAAGDLNRDGIPDLVVANADADAVDILLGAGDGTFPRWTRVSIVQGSIGGNPRGIALADHDGDGRLDVIVTEYATGAWRILYGDGNGNVVRAHSFGVGSTTHPQGVAAADFNRDGKVDVAIALAGANLVAVFLSQPNGVMAQQNVTVGGPVNVMTAGDFNKDGWLDLAAASASSSRIYTLRGAATGLAWRATHSTGASPRGVTAADINQDGRTDLITGNRTANTVSVHLGSATDPGTFVAPLTFGVGAGGRAVAAGDFDHDGAIDIASANDFGDSITVLTNTTRFVAPAFRFSVQQLTTGRSAASLAIAVADFDRDGRLDVVASAGGVVVRLASGAVIQVDGDPTHTVDEFVIADVNRDGAPDIVTAGAYFSGSPGEKNVRTYLNRGNGAFAAAPPLTSQEGIRAVAAGDFNRDGRVDVAFEATDDADGRGILRVALGRGDGTFTLASETTVPRGGKLIVADVDADGRLDILSDVFFGGVTVWYGEGDGTAARTEFYELPLIAEFAAADLNEDGRVDLIGSSSNGDIQVRLASPSGGFAPVFSQQATLLDDDFIDAIAAADMNLDGHLDLITSGLDILFGHGDGTFTFDRRSTFAADGFMRPIPADFNGDGLPDLLFLATDTINVMVNERGGVNHAPTVSAGPDRTHNFVTLLDNDTVLAATGSDPDIHELQYQWKDAAGNVLCTCQYFFVGGLPPRTLTPGPHVFTVTGSDGRGGEASDSMVLTIEAFEEIYIHPNSEPSGAWRFEADLSAADERRMRHPDAGAPKLAAPLANPVHYIEEFFPADPSQSYKLWLRLKADRNYWGNDSVFVQFDNATDTNGNPVYRIGSTSALAINLEECSGCGLSGWGWEDDGWGAKDRTTATVLRFSTGHARIRIQTREDGVSLDQIVLSARKYLTARPGSAKNDTLILPMTVEQ